MVRNGPTMISKCPKMSQNIKRSSKQPKMGTKWSEMVQNSPERPRIAQNVIFAVVQTPFRSVPRLYHGYK